MGRLDLRLPPESPVEANDRRGRPVARRVGVVLGRAGLLAEERTVIEVEGGVMMDELAGCVLQKRCRRAGGWPWAWAWSELDLDGATAVNSRQVTSVDHEIIVKDLPKTAREEHRNRIRR